MPNVYFENNCVYAQFSTVTIVTCEKLVTLKSLIIGIFEMIFALTSKDEK